MKINSHCMKGIREGYKKCEGERWERRMEERRMKVWLRAEFVVSGSVERLPRQRSCLLRLMGNRRCETHSAAAPPPSSNISSL